ncbi:MAG: hypothetical protein HW421_1452 [Ignavibacteria bacterium]|nr:hypothetical protein [Ignavibacteria bacterium]
MENKNQDWRDYKLQNEEIEMLESIERGEWRSIGNIEERRNNLRKFFNDNKEPSNNISISLDKEDYEIILKKSNQYGMNYKELIENLVHNFAIGKVIL